MNRTTSEKSARPQYVPGTRGYDQVAERFIEQSRTLPFEEINEPFLEFLPSRPGTILDLGAGAGQNAAAMARMGHRIVAVEPMPRFLGAARDLYPELDIEWVSDSLPDLASLDDRTGGFDFILVQGVWHHLDESERREATARISSLLRTGGFCGISLRNGPPGGGTHLFPTSGPATINLAAEHGLTTALHLPNRPSYFAHKVAVVWTYVVLQKKGE